MIKPYRLKKGFAIDEKMEEETNSYENNENSDVFVTNNVVLKQSDDVKDLEDWMRIKNTDRPTATEITARMNFAFSKMDCGET